ncbi:MAG: DUF6089 family protein [Niabella sp.]
MKTRFSIVLLISGIFFISGNVNAQSNTKEYIAQKNSIGISGGATTYTGRFSVGTPLAEHSSLYASTFYRRRVYKQFYVRAEGLIGRLRGDNRGVESQSGRPTGEFQTEIGEATVKGEYEFINLYRHKATPYIIAGVGAYGLFNYESTDGAKDRKDKIGFVMPVGGGVKYRLNDRFKLFAEGSVRFFNKNLDNHNQNEENNPNRYFTAGIGLIYELQPFNPLW